MKMKIHFKHIFLIFNMFRVLIFIFFLCVSKCTTRDALKYFVEHRIVQNYSFTMLSNVINSSDLIWVEYEYRFNGIKGSNTTKELTDVKNIIKPVLNVGFFENPNTPFDCKSFNENTTEELRGYSFEILNLLQERLQFGVNFIRLSYSNGEYNLTESLSMYNLDLLICHPGINYELKSEITQLHSTLKSEYVLVYKLNKLHITEDIFILTFAGTLWLCFLVLLIVLAISLHISTQRYAVIYKHELWNWVDITLWANAAACQQGLSHTPNGFASRLIFFLGYLTSYLLYTGFAAGITSLLLQQGVSNDITVSNLEKMNLNTVTVIDIPFIKSEHKFINNNSFLVADMDDLFMRINQENTIGIAPKIFIDQYFADKLNYDMINLYSTSFFTTAQYVRGFVIPKDSIYKKMLNNGLLALQESGLLANTLHQNLLPTAAPTVTSNYSSAGIEHVGSAILILLVGTLSSTVFLVAELTIAVYRSRCYSHSKIDGTGYFKHF